MNLLLLSKKINSIKNILKPNSMIGFVGTAGEVYENPIWINEDKSILYFLYNKKYLRFKMNNDKI